MKIYTKTGDTGETALFGGGRLAKSEPRIQAYGEIDELNAWLGVARARVTEPAALEALARVQQELFIVGAVLATPNPSRRKGPKFELDETRITALEREIDAWEAELPPLTTFILPGGAAAGSILHAARTVCRRAERAIVGLAAEDLPVTLLPYVNRLSDWLFVCARRVNRAEGAAEIPW